MSEQTAEAWQKAHEAEYSKYVATEAIDLDGSRAFNPGDPVPVGHVESGIVRKDQVAGINTKAAAAIKES
jgi:hypothetical protein